KSNLARYYREPSFFELFGDRGIFLGNPELEAEEGLNFDIGLQYGRGWTKSRVNRLSARVVAFYSQVDEMIARTYNARGIGKAENISEATVHGIETRLSAEVFDHFRMIGQYTYQDAENNSRIASFDGKQLPGRFRHSWLGRAEYNRGRLKLYTEYIHESDMYYDSANMRSANGGAPAPVYAPEVFAAGSSLSHLDFDAEDTIMKPTIAPGETRREWGALDVAMLRDLGYEISSVPEPRQAALLLGLFGLGYLAWRRRKLGG
ncbi:MAG: TonB-dependent receptor domain-containing protein, partial [Verrucomicrobiota bacterium]